MGVPPAERHIAQFVLSLLGTGSMLSTLVEDLADALPADAYPGEEPRAVVIDMLCGTVTTALGPADLDDLQRATELIELAGERTLEHLQLAAHLSRRSREGDSGPGRNYG